MINFIVNSDDNGKRIDLFIKSQNHELLYSRALIEKLMDSENVFVNNQTCLKKSYLLKTNDSVSVKIDLASHKKDELPLSQDIPLRIIYDDKWLSVIDKPAGMTTHPAPGNHTGTLVNALLHHFPMLHTTENPQRPGIVHRLDKDTSGLMIIAKDDKTLYELSNQFMHRQIKKTYMCICVGVPKDASGVILAPVGRHKTDRKKMSVRSDGKEAITRYEIINNFEYYSLLKVNIETGRTHQIRVHLAHINHPVMGDPVYNSVKRTQSACPLNLQKGLKYFMKNHVHRQMLHSHRLNFTHPKTANELTLQSDLPEDMVNTIEYLRKMEE